VRKCSPQGYGPPPKFGFPKIFASVGCSLKLTSGSTCVFWCTVTFKPTPRQGLSVVIADASGLHELIRRPSSLARKRACFDSFKGGGFLPPTPLRPWTPPFWTESFKQHPTGVLGPLSGPHGRFCTRRAKTLTPEYGSSNRTSKSFFLLLRKV
jgi:hypothetical protein